ncbi:MAG: helix-turn-helix domain-containing protein [Sulfurimonas sp.]|nr:helix-turn-helix domain-containing protein [Sulfurimonas sp.]PHQ90121.1 MAG: hypothetical protein COB42_05765 [Sulfurimonas sp.]
MLNMQSVVRRIKDVLIDEYKINVLDKNVAHELGLTATALSSQKSRDLIPYDALAMFCIRRKVSVNWLFFGVGNMEMDYAKKNL